MPSERRLKPEQAANIASRPETKHAPLERQGPDWSKRLVTEGDIQAQKNWQTEGSAIEITARRLFDELASGVGADFKPVALGLPETDALLAEIAQTIRDPDEPAKGQWREEIERLRHTPTTEGELDVLRLLSSREATASSRLTFFQNEFAGLLEYAVENDLARLREPSPQLPEAVPEPPEMPGTPPSEELPPSLSDTFQTSMDPLQESKEGEARGYFSVHPFWGGYYREDIHDVHVGGAHWGKKPREYTELESKQGFSDERVFRGKVTPGRVTPLPLPPGFFPNKDSLRATGEVKLLVDEHGLCVLDARQDSVTVDFTVMIGRAERTILAVEPETPAVASPQVALIEAQEALSALNGSELEKARILKRVVQKALTYSNDGSLNTVYANHPGGYFAAIEEYKKADCDVANAYFINLLSAAGLKARLVTGHYVKNKDHAGAAIMGSGTRHAWTELWDGTQWIRLDATPPKDPTLDEERPDEAPEDESGEMPGDYGEQESSELSDEQLEALREKIKEAERARKAQEESPEALENKRFAEAAGCTPEQASVIRRKIEAARQLCDRKGRVIRDAMSEHFREIVETNLREVEDWRGPVVRSEGDEMEDFPMLGKEMATGAYDPLGYAKEVKELKIEQAYGGLRTYFLFDRSGSMNEVDAGSGKAKKDEQQVAAFLMLDAIKSFSYHTEVAARNQELAVALTVESFVGAFQNGQAETLKELNARWEEKDQYDVWKGLESNVGGGTPAHKGLAMIRKQIKQELEDEKTAKARSAVSKKTPVRLVEVFMDGDVDDPVAFTKELAALKELGVTVAIWGMTNSARAVEAYPGGKCVASILELVDPVAEHIVAETIKLRAKRV